jgi:hypothetical protein
MTGGVAEPPVPLQDYNIGDTQRDLFSEMEHAYANRSMMIASINVS